MNKTDFQLNNNQRPYIPTREEFHREFSGTLSKADFDTSRPNPYNIGRIACSLAFSTRNAKDTLQV